MKPNDPRQTSLARGRARARAIIKAELWWLSGFPEGGLWVTVPSGGRRGVESLQLTGQQLHRATYAMNKLIGEFPRALPRLVSDVAAWQKGARRQIEALKPWVHQGKTPKDLWSDELYSPTLRQRIGELQRRGEVPAALLTALSWVLASRPSSATRYLKWLDQAGAELAVAMDQLARRDALIFGVQMAHLGTSISSKAGRSLSLMMQLMRQTPVIGGLVFAQHSARTLAAKTPKQMARWRLPDRPAPVLPAEVAGWPSWLLRQPKKPRRQFLRLLEVCDPLPWSMEWQGWWTEAEAVLKAAHPLLRQRQVAEQRGDLKRMRSRIERMKKQVPAPLDVAGFGGALRWLAGPEGDELFDSACRILGKLTAYDATVRMGFLMHWRDLAGSNYRVSERRNLPVLLEEMAAYVGQHHEKAAMIPWLDTELKNAAISQFQYGIDDEMLDAGATRIRLYFACLNQLRRCHPEVDTALAAERLEELLEHSGQPEDCVQRILQMHVAELTNEWFSDDQLGAAILLTEKDFAAFPKVLQELARPRNAQLEILAPVLISAFGEHRTLLIESLANQNRRLLIECGSMLMLLESLDQVGFLVPPVRQPRPPWLQEYPAELRPALGLLDAVSPEAQAVAAKVWSSAQRSRASLTKERQALTDLLNTADSVRRSGLVKRLANIEQRLTQREKLSAAKLRRLEDKIRRRTVALMLQGAIPTLRQRLEAAWVARLGLPAAPPWLLADRVLEVLVHLAGMNKAERKLAHRLLYLRSAPPPWDLRDDPRNARFLRRLEELAIDWRPWVEGIGRVAVASGEQQMVLELEPDPLEIFHMGSHFKTCLSVGGFSFFAVLANAADINKRVLYARDANGRVVGRRLICLTDSGAILSFFAYSHQKDLDFEQHSTRFVQQLAERMGTLVADRGKVPNLVAADWYDDGPVDLAMQFDFLRPGCEFRCQLLARDIEEIPDLIEGLPIFDLPQREAIAMPMLLQLSEFNRRPELMLALLPWLRDRRWLQGDIVEHIVLRFVKLGRGEQAAHLFASRLFDNLLQQIRDFDAPSQEILDFLASHRPSQVLRLLVRTRPARVRAWTQEDTLWRLWAAAAAMKQLRRLAKARELYQLAAKAYGPADWRRRARAQARRLAA